MLSRFQIILVVAFSSFFFSGNAQDSLVLGKIDRIQSKILNEERIINIYFPMCYNPDSVKNYPVVYLLDGSAREDFIHISGIFQYDEFYKIASPCIVVGIENVDRKRDFTFPTNVAADKEKFPTTGGSEKFIAFLESELMPFMQEYYNVSSHRTLIGQSLGGLFACEILAKKPALFENYLIISPSLWWDNQSLLTYIKNGAISFESIQKIYLSVGKEHPLMIKESKQLAGILERKLGKNFKFDFLKDFNHDDILHQAAYNGIGWLFALPK